MLSHEHVDVYSTPLDAVSNHTSWFHSIYSKSKSTARIAPWYSGHNTDADF
jgi:hypothetical protein